MVPFLLSWGSRLTIMSVIVDGSDKARLLCSLALCSLLSMVDFAFLLTPLFLNIYFPVDGLKVFPRWRCLTFTDSKINRWFELRAPTDCLEPQLWFEANYSTGAITAQCGTKMRNNNEKLFIQAVSVSSGSRNSNCRNCYVGLKRSRDQTLFTSLDLKDPSVKLPWT